MKAGIPLRPKANQKLGALDERASKVAIDGLYAGHACQIAIFVATSNSQDGRAFAARPTFRRRFHDRRLFNQQIQRE